MYNIVQILNNCVVCRFQLRNVERGCLLFEIAGLEVPCHRGQLDLEAVQLFRHRYLAAQSTCLGQSKGQVEHVVLIIFGLGHFLVVFLFGNDDVAR